MLGDLESALTSASDAQASGLVVEVSVTQGCNFSLKSSAMEISFGGKGIGGIYLQVSFKKER